ncbi:MAG: phosphate ABC transporter permease PstA [bacterium]
MAQLLNSTTRRRLDRNEVWIWCNAGALALSLCAVIFIVLLIMRNGLVHFWPNPIYAVTYKNPLGQSETIIGERVEINTLSRTQFLEGGGEEERLTAGAQQVERWLFNTGNRRTHPPDFRWIYAHDVLTITTPAELAKIERTEWGPAFGRIVELRFDNADGSKRIVNDAELAPLLQNTLARLNTNREAIARLERGTINQINAELKTIRLQQRALNLNPPADAATRQQQLDSQEAVLLQTYREQEQILSSLLKNLEGSALVLEVQTSTTRQIDLADILHVTFPNNMSMLSKLATFLSNVGRFLSDDPREANTEGGVFPAIFGTVLMVLLMSVVVTPVGVVTAIYLHEYASQTGLVRMLRIAVSNLAGVPSIVYGVFGLGFFVYFLGGNIDQLFYAEALPAPTFGTPGLFWASLTLALLTVPVVIVSTEEGLARIPRSLREGSLALGATRAETLFQVVLPMATPAVLTGVILAVARAAGEVAPLMLVGVVKLAPALPIDGEFPFLHLDRKFMHLGFHVYDVGFQSPNVEAARPLVYATAMLLISIIVGLNLAAITLRHRLEKRYRSYE